MLVLARKQEEVIVIEVGGEKVYLVVVGVKNGVVRLGFTASQSVRIDRQEVAIAKAANP